MSRISLKFIAAYRKILSPFIGGQCRFSPTCSRYAEEAVEKHGAIKGWLLAILRIMNCHPWSKRPWKDPVPERFAWRQFLGYKQGLPEKTASREKRKDEQSQ
jgi:hypothetical protein